MSHEDSIELATASFKCIMGFAKAERTRTQVVTLDLGLYLDTAVAARSGELHDTVDYVRVLGETRFILEECQFILIETAAEALASYLLLPPVAHGPMAALQRVQIALGKPEVILSSASPTLRIGRRASDLRLPSQWLPCGRLERVCWSAECSLHRLILAPGQSALVGAADARDESDMVLGSGINVQGRDVGAGSVLRWPRGTVRRYENRSRTEQALLFVDRPARPFPEKLGSGNAAPSGTWVEPVDYYQGVPQDYLRVR